MATEIWNILQSRPAHGEVTVRTADTPSIRTETCGAALVITILEEQLRDVSLVSKLQAAMAEAVKKQSATVIVIDLHRTLFIGSIGFLAFLSLRRLPEVKRMILCNLAPQIRDLFEICKLIPSESVIDAPFEVANTLSLALAMNAGPEQ